MIFWKLIAGLVLLPFLAIGSCFPKAKPMNHAQINTGVKMCYDKDQWAIIEEDSGVVLAITCEELIEPVGMLWTHTRSGKYMYPVARKVKR